MDDEYFSKSFALFGAKLSRIFSDNQPKIPTKPVMSAEAAAYPKLFKVFKELKRQNETIFEAEKERNVWEIERDDLKGLTRFTTNPKAPTRLIGNKRLIGRKLTEQTVISRIRKAYMNA